MGTKFLIRGHTLTEMSEQILNLWDKLIIINYKIFLSACHVWGSLGISC